MKTRFETPVVELVKFGVEDVVTASAIVGGGKDEDSNFGGLH